MSTLPSARKKRDVWKQGVRDGIPIFLGYFAVSFAFGIRTSQLGIGAGSATLLSFMNLTSAGQLAALDVIARAGSYLSMAFLQLVVNIRYLLMSASLSQRVSPDLPLRHRMLMAYGITDEVFALSAVAPKPLSPFYTYGLITSAVPGWCLGTLFGALMGGILPTRIISALGVAIYGMFLAIIIPAATEKKPVRFCVIASMLAGLALTYLPVLKKIPSNYRLILITLAVSLAAAVLFPVDDDMENGRDAGGSDGGSSARPDTEQNGEAVS